MFRPILAATTTSFYGFMWTLNLNPTVLLVNNETLLLLESSGSCQRAYANELAARFSLTVQPVHNRDYDMTAPLHADGGNYPCKGYHSLVDTPQGRAVVRWQPGQTYNFTLAGSVPHGGGSCQVSLSLDKGQTWKVLHSYVGKCPLSPTWQFTLPADTPAGNALFAWSWFNKVGNREMYMNCAHVTIDPVSGSDNQSEANQYSINERPLIFAANIGNGCGTIEGFDLAFPQPGPKEGRST
ncbi:hypothetical protein HC256_004143 [Beauveria bassiana]|nr:hypothetical protein HC256_004143 [Beauveria bassiana]